MPRNEWLEVRKNRELTNPDFAPAESRLSRYYRRYWRDGAESDAHCWFH